MFDFRSYFEALTIPEALTCLSGVENPAVIAGGTDVLIKLRERKGFVGADMVGVARIPELRRISVDERGNMLIGAAVTFSELEANGLVRENLRALADGAGAVGGPQIRNVGTIGGNICNGAVSADTAPSMLAYNAVVLIESGNGPREVKITEFYEGPGRVRLQRGELVRGFRINKEDYEGFGGCYIKFSQRKAMDISTLGCAAVVKEREGKIEALRIAFGVAAPTPVRAYSAEEYAVGFELCDENLEAIGLKCLENTRARDSWRGSKLFREQLIRTLSARAINGAVKGGLV